MQALTKSSNSLLISALAFSFLLHVAMVISVMNIKIPEHSTTRADFEAWVKSVAPTKREAILLPEVPQKIKPKPETRAEETPPAAAEGSASQKTSSGSGDKAAKAAYGGSGGSPDGIKAARRSKLRTAGILGVIGVASGSGGGSDLGNVFSSDSGKISDDLGQVMEGKQRVEVANSGNISRQALKGSGGGGGGGSGPADIGGIASTSSGRVDAGVRQGSDILVASVSSASSGTVVSGNVDQRSILSVIARKNGSFTRCYERALRNNSELAGRVGYEISVSVEGSVLDVRFIEDTLHAREVLDCIRGILMRLEFPAPKGGPAIFSSVLVFGTH